MKKRKEERKKKKEKEGRQGMKEGRELKKEEGNGGVKRRGPGYKERRTKWNKEGENSEK